MGFNMPTNIFQLLRSVNVNPAEIRGIKTPDEMAQFLLNSGKVTQAQVNQVRQMWNNPQIKSLFNNRRQRTGLLLYTDHPF